MEFLKELKFDDKGLIPAVVQDSANGEVLMVAYMNEEAVRKTLESGLVTLWSRSRKTYWVKGESSGHTQKVKEVYYDCDGDTLLIKVEQKVAACHEGYRSCFFRKVEKGKGNLPKGKIVGRRLFDPKEVYKK